ncbi:type VI secretion system protein TssA [Xanthomonas citri pv. glycines]|uniref:Type VI secretion system protein TssA n=3 Tax=Xanthomonas TaxID=338 RepID=A0AAW8ZXE8_9XANT|nr:MULTISPECIES: type VI secretion system protein TssA [Xanthomonas]ATS51785.1 type VI secretion system protein TssA [Xanthomonas citri pv. phaseoli var. fuscans]ATS80298.1 type VI secretion system protein TssA [Xanthomonas citri pv. phaseoli var. fuscans]KHS36254.1 type VI secretion protein [Xanthomonas phaseoli pv. phaseoli]MDV7250554.1 type VI secretion system protein TssA [Xanthomonas hortorum pv. vitians]WAH66512.1 type VI secretion system protein TssA [Xanthomonas hortorum]
MLDLDVLLTPISDKQSAGEDLSFSIEFDRIQEARRSDDPTLDQGEWQTDIKYADWSSVARQCGDLLQTRTKDLRLAGWLTEAITQIDGFAGLALGYRLIAGLCDRYWDEVHPLVVDGDHEERIGNLSWLLTNSLQWLRAVPIASGPQGRFGLNDFEAAHTRSANPGSGDEEGQPSLELLEAARRDTPHDFYRQLVDALLNCAETLQALQAAVDERLGIDGPSFSAVREQVEHLQRTVARFARDAGLLLDGEADAGHHAMPDIEFDSTATKDAAPPAPSALREPGSAPTTRKEALAQLRRVAEFFRRTEPHSPVAYLAEKAARWGEMPLHVWLKRVIKDDSVLNQMEEMLDVNQNLDQ